MKNSSKLLLLSLILALFAMACGIGDSVSEQIEQQVEDVAGELEATVEAAAQEVEEQAAQVQEEVEQQAEQAQEQVEQQAEQAQEQVEEAVSEAEAGAGETEVVAVEFNSINEELAAFDSYRSDISMEFSGTDTAGQPTDGKIAIFLEYIKEPSAMHMRMNMEGSTVEEAGGFGSFDIYNVDNMLYMQNPEDQSWISFPSTEEDQDPFAQGFFSPDDLLEIPDNARRGLLPQNVNGISTWHYTFDENDIDDSDMAFSNAKGEMWVAREGGYPVKIEFEATGRSLNPDSDADLFAEGTVKISYELRDINQSFTIDLPEEALNAEGFGDLFGSTDPEDIAWPLPDDAEIDFSMEGLVSFYTAGSVNDMAEFYKQALAAEGWTIDESFAFVSEDSALLSFSKDGVDLTVSVNLEDDGRVNVSIISSE